jgi:DNA repair exonuclease SbcCD nuclease subunit
MFRFLHAADLHLDSPLRGLERYEGAPATRIRDAVRRALENLVRVAIDRKVAFVLIAGDVYDGDWKDYATGLFFSAKMADLRKANIPVFLIRGNHDAANHLTRSLELPGNVRLFGEDRPATHTLDELRVAVHGQSFASRETRENLAAGYPAPVSGYFNIGLLHTSLQGDLKHDTYAPCTAEQLAQRGYDYWALGHIHLRQVVRPARPAIVFPGNIQGRHVRETGEKGCHLVEVAGGRIVANEFIPLDVVRWDVIEIDATGLAGTADILDIVQERMREAVEAAEGRLLAARLHITGATAAHEVVAVDREAWIQQCRAQCNDYFREHLWIEKIVFSTRPPGESTTVKLPEDALAEIHKLVEELRTDDEGLARLLEEIRHLDNRLPLALRDGDDAPRLARPEFARGLLDRVLPLITSPHWHERERP